MTEHISQQRTPNRNSKTKLASSGETPIRQVVDPGITRRVSDICVDLHKYIQQWHALNQSSFQTINTLNNLTDQIRAGESSNDITDISDECRRKYILKLVENKDDILRQLLKKMENFKELIHKISKLVQNFKAIYFLDLAANSSSPETTVDVALFRTWKSEMFYQKARKLGDMFTKEFLLKEQLAGKIVNKASQNEQSAQEEGDSSSLNVSLWLQQPYIETHASFILDSMLFEAGLKEF